MTARRQRKSLEKSPAAQASLRAVAEASVARDIWARVASCACDSFAFWQRARHANLGQARRWGSPPAVPTAGTPLLRMARRSLESGTLEVPLESQANPLAPNPPSPNFRSPNSQFPDSQSPNS